MRRDLKMRKGKIAAQAGHACVDAILAALKKEEDALSQGRLRQLQKELAEQRADFAAMKTQWENEKSAIGKAKLTPST